MADISVSSKAELLTALASARGGETIVLESGNYGSLDLNGVDFSSYVTIKSKTALGATFSEISFQNSSFIAIDGVHVDNTSNGGTASALVSVTDGSENIIVRNSEINGKVDSIYNGHFGLYTKDVKNVTFDNNYIHDVKRGGVFYSAEGLKVTENEVNYIGDDTFKFIGVRDVLIENNTGARFVYPEEGAHLDFIQFQGNDSSDIIVRGNVSLPGNWTNVQGIFFDDAHYTNVLIEQNIVVTGMYRGVSVSSGTNVVIRNNTVLDIEGGGSKATKAGGDALSYDNIQGSYLQDAGDDGRNITLQQADRNADYHYDDFFANATAGRGITLEDLRPVPGSLAETTGAFSRILELLNGTQTSQEPPAPEPDVVIEEPDVIIQKPEPQPEPEPETDDDDASIETPGVGDAIKKAYALIGEVDVTSANSVILVEHETALELTSATIAATFNLDSANGYHGILSKDASFFEGGGNHFTSYVHDGVLFVRFQNGVESKIFKIGGINPGEEYDLVATFGDGAVSVWLDGKAFGAAAFNTSWATNTEYLQIGANGWSSATGSPDFVHVFGGTISDVLIVEGVFSPAEITTVINSLKAEMYPDTSEPDTGDNGTSDPVTVPDSIPVERGPEVVFSLAGDTEFSGNLGDAVNIAHTDDLAISEGTIAFSFNADNVNLRQGLISKDASFYDGGGNHFSSWIEKGRLNLRFQDEDEDALFTFRKVSADKDYDVRVNFDDSGIEVFVDDQLIGTSDLVVDFAQNGQYLQVGALGWSSADGAASITNGFDGTISDVLIFSGVVSDSSDPLLL